MYLDTAILVKLLVREQDSAWFNTALEGETLETSELALAEVRSALLAKERAGHIASSERRAAAEQFEQMVTGEILLNFPLNRAVIERAVEMQHACHPRIPLRTLDALHLATCDLNRCGSLSTTDRRLRDACEHFAIRLLPESAKDLPAPN